MSKNLKKIRVGIVGCGAIGSRIAVSIKGELRNFYVLAGLYDIQSTKAKELEKITKSHNIIKNSVTGLLKDCQLMVEAVNAKDTQRLIKQALAAKKHVLAMSVGRLLDNSKLFDLAREKSCHLLIPSGAIAGIDALKSISSVQIDKIQLTTRKPLTGFLNNPYLQKQKIDITKITKETVLFEGNVDAAVAAFPQNINIAATIALATRAKNKLMIRILTSPEYSTNSHEIEACGAFGKLHCRTENVVCPDNPKTSYLAVLSAIQTLKEFCSLVKIGT